MTQDMGDNNSTPDTNDTIQEQLKIMLASLMQTDKQALTKLIKQEVKQKAEPLIKKAKQYKRVKQTIICLHCSSKLEETFCLSKSESKLYIDEMGNACQLVYEDADEDVCLQTYAVSCSSCASAIKRWSREELEHRYISILMSCGIHAFSQEKKIKLQTYNADKAIQLYGDGVPDYCIGCTMLDEEAMKCRRIAGCKKADKEIKDE